MNTRELKKYFKDHLVPSKLYKIGGSHKNRICLDKTESGWAVYFQDKRRRSESSILLMKHQPAAE